MNKNFTTTPFFFAVALILAVAGCGSSGSSTASLAPSAAQSKVFGVAALDTTATSTVTVKDSSLPSQEKTAVLSSNGSYTADVSGLKAPFILKAMGTDETGGTVIMYSVSANGGRANINEISDLAVAASASVGTIATSRDMSDSWSNSTTDDNHRTADNFNRVINSLQTVLAPLFALYNVTGSPVSDDSEDSNNGLTALLHDVRFTVTNGNVVVTNRATGSIIFSGPRNNLASGTIHPENMPAGPGGSAGGSTACTSFTYSAWGTCQSNGTQTRTVVTSSPTGCTGGSPVLSQSCTPAPSPCTYNYSSWGTCQPGGTQTRTMTSSPSGCTGTPAALSQSCTYVPPVNTCTSFTYSAWGTCSNGTQTRTVLTSLPAGCTGGSPALSQSCTSPVTLTLAQVTTTCTACHGLTVNGVMLASGGYTVTGRAASAWVTALTGMMTPPAGTTYQDFGNFLAALSSTTPTTCTSFTYSAWGACQSNGTQTRTVATSTPTGCTGGTPALSQSCTYVPPVTTCTSFTYSAWGACQSNGTQTRTVATSTPTGCTGGTPALSQSCTYVPPVTTCTSFTYSAWGACQSNGTQTRTVATSTPTGCTGGTPALSQSCTYVPPVTTCTSFTYSAWGTCQSNGSQTRTVATSTPTGCTGGTPVLSQTCTYVPPTCTSFTYSAWGTCQSNGTQTRTVATSTPTGCTGGTPVLSQTCTYVPPTCTSFTYSAWGTCQSNGTQTRTVATSTPTGCTGGTPVLSQTCTPTSTVTTALVQSTCTRCHGLTVNNTTFASGGYTAPLGRTASQWVSSLTGMFTPPAGTTIQDFANFLVTVP